MSGSSRLRFFGLVAVAAACGGRTVDEMGSAGGSSGATSSAGSASGGSGMSMGARAGVAGRSGAGGNGGTVAAGGANMGGVSSAGTPTAGGCGPCPLIDCAPGSTPRMLPGWCCAQCVNEDCSVGRAEYELVREQLLDKYASVGCMLDGDCTYWYEANQCAVGCGVPVLTSMLQNLESNLSGLAEAMCRPDCMPPIPPCPLPKPAACVQGRCQ